LLNAFSASLIRTDQSSFPILVGGAFNDQVDGQSTWREFPAATARVPRVLLQIDGRQAALRITVPIAPDTSTVAAEEELRALLAQAETWSQAQLQMQVPPSLLGRNGEADRSAWEDAVGDAIQLIHQQRFQKVVLAREERLEASEPFSPVATLSRLRAVDPDPTLFAVRSGESWFLGASPERLVRLSNGTVDVSCLAGSIGLGDSDDERRQLASELLRSEKDRLEHELVVGPILESLGQVCDDIERLPGTPRVVPARSVQHLETPITAHLRRPGHVLELVDRLHPTPAVGGFPRQPALQAIRALEQIERGWYAGPLGWTDLEGNGEFIVALRSALIAGTSARVFAGCGIVADSIPASEYEETRLKMRPMLAALGAM
jgi:isochorismate synthase